MPICVSVNIAYHILWPEIARGGSSSGEDVIQKNVGSRQETDKLCQFLDGHSEAVIMNQFVDPETDIMGEKNYMKYHKE